MHNTWRENWLRTFSDKELAELLIEGLNISAQLEAIRSELRRNVRAEEEYEIELKALSAEASAATGEYAHHLVDAWTDGMHHGVYLDAARSMAAVGLLVPLIESMFASIFCSLQRRSVESEDCAAGDKRSAVARALYWNPRVVIRRDGEVEKDFVRGVTQLSESTGLSLHFPRDYQKVLEALYRYRNCMLHNGLEWPAEVRHSFSNQKKNWPEDWFTQATSGGSPWVFYMSRTFIDHCLRTVEEILGGVGKYMRTLEANQAS